MTAFATADDFATRIGETLSNAEQTRANALLDQASNLIRDAVKQEISKVADDVFTRSGTTDKRILLPERPVISVASVTIDGQPITDWYVSGDELVRRPITLVNQIVDDTSILPFGLGFGWEAQRLAITYTHGYDVTEIPEICRSIVKEMVARVWTNPGNVIQETVGNVQTTYAPYAEPPRGLMLTDHERAELRRFFGSSAKSVWIGG